MTLIVYGKVACPQCTATENYLKNNAIPYTKVDVTKDPAGLKTVLALGYKSMPVVVNGHNHWSGFDIDKLQKLKSK